MTTVSGLRRYLVCAVAVGALAVLISWRLLPDPQLEDYALLVAEVGIGAAIAIAVYGISRKNENELHEVAAEARKLSQMQVDDDREAERGAERRMASILHEIEEAAAGVLEQAHGTGSAGPKHGAELEARHKELERASEKLISVSHHNYWIKNFEKIQALYDLCARCPARAGNEPNLAFYSAVRTEAQKLLKETPARPGPSGPRDAQSAGQPVHLWVSADRTEYPLGSTVYARAKIGRLLSGSKITYELLDPGGAVLDRQDLDPGAFPDPDLARHGIFEVSFKMRGDSWKAGGVYAVRATYGASSAKDRFLVTENAPEVLSDMDAYVAGSDMIITVIDPDGNKDSNAVDRVGDGGGTKLIIESPRGRISGYRLLETGTATSIFQGTVSVEDASKSAAGPAAELSGKLKRLLGPAGAFASRIGRTDLRERGPDGGSIKCGRGEEITIRYSNKTGAAVRTVSVARSGAAVEMDQKVYTCTDKVQITVVAPDLAGGAAAEKSCRVSVGTSIGRLAGYELVEREPGSSVFVGSVLLTGFADLAHKMPSAGPFGATRGRGPYDGMLACMSDDRVEVAVDAGGRTYRGAALARWNSGSVQFLRPSYAVGESAVVRVVDPDMNLDPGAVDSFGVRVTSDSDRDGIEVVVKETDPASGIFDGAFRLGYERSSEADSALLVSYGDTIYATYVDTTLPPPSGPSDRAVVGSTAIVSAGGALPPLERLKIESVSASRKTGPGALNAGDPSLIRIAVGGAREPYSFTVLLQIRDSAGVGPPPLAHPARIYPQQTFECEFRWTPPGPGRFVLEVFLWKSIEDMTPFCPPKEVAVDVS